MSGLNFLQAMSNTAAENVSGPIDMLGWALRKAGIPVPQDAMLSSDWMRKKGLIVDVPQDASSLAGQTAGLLAPIAAVAKAPQIAKGLLQAGDNLAAPTMAGPAAAQRGAIVYHGSPHKFDKFDASKIGTGEGAQAYGHGLYLAESPDVAQNYKTALEGKARSSFKTGRGETGTSGVEREAADIAHMMQTYGPVERGWLGRELGARGLPADTAKLVRQYLKSPVERLTDGALYKVDLPDEHIAKMLDWDKPLSQQAPEVREAVNQMLGPPGSSKMLDDRLLARPTKSGGVEYSNKFGAAYQSLSAKDKAAMSQILQRSGIPGIRYLDGGSRGAGTGTSNYVVFPGNEDILKILERNGQPLGLLSP